MSRPVRVLISKIGLDGHDRGAKLIVRNLRDAGMEVIYTGLWQTPASTVHAAVQEDVDVLGVSLLSAAHMTIMPELRRLCTEAGMADLPLMVGGIIPAEDGIALREAGIDGVFNPGTPMSTVIDAVRQLALRRQSQRASDQQPPRIDTAAGVARAISWIAEDRGQELPQLADDRPHIRIGITGSPGVGKSTFIGKLSDSLQSRGHRVGVIAVDPTSPITGGSVLGDRLRMMSAEPQESLFVRSLASAGTLGGLAPHCEEIARLLVSAGYEIILIETVGAGQNDTEVRHLADEVLLLLMPGAGDSVQFSKAGVVEIATGFIVNKADLPGADSTIRQLKESVADERPAWSVNSLRGQGFDPLCTWLEDRLKTASGK
ncbi:MAG: cobalamin-dependent protein [Planctomycetota bacterium]